LVILELKLIFHYRKRDQEDVKAFSKRLLEKDKEKRRNVMEKSDKRGYDEAAKRLALGKK